MEQIRFVLYEYYSKMSPSFSAAAVTTQTIGSPRVYNDILLGHLVYKCIIKMAVWLWHRIDKVNREEVIRNQAWVSSMSINDMLLTYLTSQLQELFHNSAIQVKTLSELRTNIVLTLARSGLSLDASARRSVDILTRHIRLFGKFFRRLQQLSQTRFAALPMCGDLVLFYWSQVVDATSGSPELIGGMSPT